MAKRANPATPPVPDSLRRRMEKAVEEGRFSEAALLALQRHLQIGSEESAERARTLFQRAIAEAIRQANEPAARALLSQAEGLPGAACWWVALAEYAAQLGDIPLAQRMLDHLPPGEVRPNLLGFIADRAMQLPASAGQKLLPPEHHVAHARIREAFEHYEAGRDEQARLLLHDIGIQSPFLEWKLLLRGLIAYANHDHLRAIENWHRLADNRYPAQMIASLRFGIDPHFREQQSGPNAARLYQQSIALGDPLLKKLHALQRDLQRRETFIKAFPRVQAIVAELRTKAPSLVTRLGRFLYSLIVRFGVPEVIDRYLQTFGAPPDDPRFLRAQAIAMEQLDQPEMALVAWLGYVTWMEQHPERWSGELGCRARAAVWNRMASMERSDLPEETIASLFVKMRISQAQREYIHLLMSREGCYQQSLKIDPAWPVPAEGLLRLWSDSEEDLTHHEADIRLLLERFPRHAGILVLGANLLLRLGHSAEALTLYDQLVQLDPLNKPYRQKLTSLLIRESREQYAAGDWEAAGRLIRRALEHDDGSYRVAILCGLAVLARRAGDAAEAASHLQQAEQVANARLEVAFRSYAESHLGKLPRKEILALGASFHEMLASDVTPLELVRAASCLLDYGLKSKLYRGYATDQKKIMSRLDMMTSAVVDEDALVVIGSLLVAMKRTSGLGDLASNGQRRYPANPYFSYFHAIALLEGKRRPHYLPIALHLREALRKIREAPDARYRDLETTIEQLKQRNRELEDIELLDLLSVKGNDER